MESKRFKARNVLYMLLAFVVAAGIWFYVDETGSVPAERVIADVPILYTGEDTVLADRGLMLLEEGTDTKMDVTVQGGRRLISRLDASKIRIIADLSKIALPGEQQVSYELRFTDRQRFASVSTTPSITMATVNISELYSKTVEVRCDLVGNVAEGFNAGQLELSHTNIDIWGQEEAVSPVRYAKVTLDIGSATESVSASLPVRFYDARGQLLESANIRTTVEQVQATLPVFVTKELELAIGFTESAGARLRNMSYEIRPAAIMVSGPAEALNGKTAIVLGTFDLLTVGEGGTHTYAITVPEGCTNLSGVTRATLTISYRDMARAQVTTHDVQFENAPEGKDVGILTEEVTVSIFGTAADVEAVTGEDVALVADLSDYGSALGTYTIPARVQIGTGGDIGITGTYQVQVTIRPAGTEEPEPDGPETGEAGDEP